MTAAKTYEVVATRDGKWWALEVPGLDMGYSQARHVSDIEMMAKDLIALLTDTNEDSFDITVRINVPGAEEVAAADRLRAEAERARRAADEATRKVAVALVAQRVPVRDIATLLRVSPGWVSVLTKDTAA